MMTHGFAEQRAGGVLVAGGENERAEIVQYAEIGRRAAKKLQIVALGLLEQAPLPEQAGALKARVEGIRVPLQRSVEFLDTSTVCGWRRMLAHLCNSGFACRESVDPPR